MPYTGEGDDTLPENVKKMPKGKREQWVAVFNSTFESCIEDGGDKKECEKKAFTYANGVAKKRFAEIIEALLNILGLSNKPCEGCNKERKIVEVDAWDGSPAQFESTDAYCSACLIDVNEAAGNTEKKQSHCMLPVRRPGDGKDVYVKQAVHAAAGGHGITQVKKPDDVAQGDWDGAVKAAANQLIKAYGEMDEEAPESCMKLAGKTRAVALGGVIEQIMVELPVVLDDASPWINDVYLDGEGTFLLCSSKGKLYRLRIDVDGDNLVSMGKPEEVHDVQVRIGKLTLTALVSGSLNDFATVSFYVSPEGSGGAKVLVSFQYSWDAIAHSTNTGKPLLP